MFVFGLPYNNVIVMLLSNVCVVCKWCTNIVEVVPGNGSFTANPSPLHSMSGVLAKLKYCVVHVKLGRV